MDLERYLEKLKSAINSNTPRKLNCERCQHEGITCVIHSSSQERIVTRNRDTPIAETLTLFGKDSKCPVLEGNVSMTKNAEDLIKIFGERSLDS